MWSLKITWEIQWMQNVAARLVLNVNTFDHISIVLAHLHQLPVSFKARFKVSALTHKALHGLGLHYLFEHLCLETSTLTSQSSQTMLATLKETMKTFTRNWM